jgi:hypothetical protein
MWILPIILYAQNTLSVSRFSTLKDQNKYYILEREKNNALAITTKCGQYNFIEYNDSLLIIGCHLAGTFKCSVSNLSEEGKSKIVACNAEVVNVGHIDTSVCLKLQFNELTETTTRIIMNRISYEKSIDTFYATKTGFINHFKKLELRCNKKAELYQVTF